MQVEAKTAVFSRPTKLDSSFPAMATLTVENSHICPIVEADMYGNHSKDLDILQSLPPNLSNIYSAYVPLNSEALRNSTQQNKAHNCAGFLLLMSQVISHNWTQLFCDYKDGVLRYKVTNDTKHSGKIELDVRVPVAYCELIEPSQAKRQAAQQTDNISSNKPNSSPFPKSDTDDLDDNPVMPLPQVVEEPAPPVAMTSSRVENAEVATPEPTKMRRASSFVGQLSSFIKGNRSRNATPTQETRQTQSDAEGGRGAETMTPTSSSSSTSWKNAMFAFSRSKSSKAKRAKAEQERQNKVRSDDFYAYMQASHEPLQQIFGTVEQQPVAAASPTPNALHNNSNSSNSSSSSSNNNQFFFFAVYSDMKQYLFAVKGEKMKTRFVSAMISDCREACGPQLWAAKRAAIDRVRHLYHGQLMHQLDIYEEARAKARNSGLREENLPVTSAYKTKSGVLSVMATGFHQSQGRGAGGNTNGGNSNSSSSNSSSGSSSRSSSKKNNGNGNNNDNNGSGEVEVTGARHFSRWWRDFYFVLHEGVLYYYMDSKSTAPTGFIMLRYVSLCLHPKSLALGQSRFVIRSPLCTIICQAKHSVALSEWVSCLQSEIDKRRTNRITSSSSSNGVLDGSSSPSPLEDPAPSPLSKFSINKFFKSSPTKRGGGGASSSLTKLFSKLGSPTASSSPPVPDSKLDAMQRSQSTPDVTLNTSHNNNNNNNNTSLLQTEQLDATAVLNESGGGPLGMPKLTKQSSMDVLEHIHGLIHQNLNFEALTSSQSSQEGFLVFLDGRADSGAGNPVLIDDKTYDIGGPELQFYLTAVEYSKVKVSRRVLQQQVDDSMHKLVKTFFETKLNIPTQLSEQVRVDYNTHNVTPALFQEVEHFLRRGLLVHFESYRDFAGKSQVKRDTRRIKTFEGDMTQCFILKHNKWVRSKVIHFDPNNTVFTIGRDKSNSLVIGDSRVSRSHARVEYSATQCEYIDLGSSCGSHLNGKAVLRSKLQHGDVLELGQSTLIFKVKKKEPTTTTNRIFTWLNG